MTDLSMIEKAMEAEQANLPSPEKWREIALREDQERSYCYPHNYSKELRALCIPTETIFMPQDIAEKLVDGLYKDCKPEDIDTVIEWFGQQEWVGCNVNGKTPHRLNKSGWLEKEVRKDDYSFWPKHYVKYVRTSKDVGEPFFRSIRAMLADWKESERMADDLCIQLKAGHGFWFNHRPALDDWHSSTEFRCYYKAGLGWRASYYDYYKPSGCKLYLMFADKLAASIYEFLQQVPVQDFGDKPTVIDIVMTVDGWKIIELNPGWLSDPCLYNDTEDVPEQNGLYLMDGSIKNIVKVDWPL